MSIKDFDIRIALLLHDIGKPFSYQDKRGIRHFHNHADESEKIAKKVLDRIELPKTKTKEICYLIKYHDLPIEEQDLENNLEISLKRYEIQKCDALAHNPNKLEKRIDYLKGVKEKIKLYGK
jgi:tRNA nucleotidyltransferase (CCA-adding enzyme)